MTIYYLVFFCFLISFSLSEPISLAACRFLITDAAILPIGPSSTFFSLPLVILFVGDRTFGGVEFCSLCNSSTRFATDDLVVVVLFVDQGLWEWTRSSDRIPIKEKSKTSQ